MRLLLLMEFCVLRFWFFLIYNKLLLNFCLKQIENNGPLINMIYKVLKNSAQGLLSGIHVRLLASELRSSHCFSTQQSMFTYSGFYRCLGVNSRAFCKIFFLFSFFFSFLVPPCLPTLESVCKVMADFGFILSCFENGCVKQRLLCAVLKM